MTTHSFDEWDQILSDRNLKFYLLSKPWVNMKVLVKCMSFCHGTKLEGF